MDIKIKNFLNFAFPNKSENEKTKILETAQRNSEFLYKLLRSEYSQKYRDSKLNQNEVFWEAVGALDQMQEKYLNLKKRSNHQNLDRAIELEGKWFSYLNCIEIMINHIVGSISKEPDLDPASAKILSKELYEEFDKLLKEHQN